MFIGLSRQGPNGLMDIYPARDQKGIMKHFIPPGTKKQETCDPLRGQDIVKIDHGGVACSD